MLIASSAYASVLTEKLVAECIAWPDPAVRVDLEALIYKSPERPVLRWDKLLYAADLQIFKLADCPFASSRVG